MLIFLCELLPEVIAPTVPVARCRGRMNGCVAAVESLWTLMIFYWPLKIILCPLVGNVLLRTFPTHATHLSHTCGLDACTIDAVSGIYIMTKGKYRYVRKAKGEENILLAPLVMIVQNPTRKNHFSASAYLANSMSLAALAANEASLAIALFNELLTNEAFSVRAPTIAIR